MEERDRADTVSKLSAERVVCVVPDSLFYPLRTGDVSIRELWATIWAGRWLIAALGTVFAIVSVVYVFPQPNWYRAEVLLLPEEFGDAPPIGGQLGGIAALAGLNLSGVGSVEAVATARSRELASEFIADFNLLPLFFSGKWNSDTQRWRDSDESNWPDARDAVAFFHRHVLSIEEDTETGLVTLAVEWQDPSVALQWAEVLVRRVNDRQRQRALREAELNVAFLQEEMKDTELVVLQESIGRLLERELQKLLLAKGKGEFAFRVVDKPYALKGHVRPKRALVCVVAALLGLVIGVIYVFVMKAIRPFPNGSTEHVSGN